jgi:hypothetical protein
MTTVTSTDVVCDLREADTLIGQRSVDDACQAAERAAHAARGLLGADAEATILTADYHLALLSRSWDSPPSSADLQDLHRLYLAARGALAVAAEG